MPVPYYHVVFTLPADLGALAYQNKARVYGLLLKTAAETLTTIAADPKHLGARIGAIAVLHSWGQTLDHPPTPIASCRPAASPLMAAAGSPVGRASSCRCGCSRACSVACSSRASSRPTAGVSSRPSVILPGSRSPAPSGPTWQRSAGATGSSTPRRRSPGRKQVLAYLARYTHRVAISNRRLVALDNDGQVSFRWKDYRASGRTKPKIMRVSAGEFMRRFLLHVLPDGFHRIRHYGLFANGHRAAMLARCREFLDVPPTQIKVAGGENDAERRGAKVEIPACPCCGGPMRIIERFEGPGSRRYPASQA